MHYNHEKELFLKNLDKSKNKTVYAKITSLTFDELPIETIEGRVTSGSINLDGNSAVRRSCSLSLTAKDFEYDDYYWGINTKFKLEIGVQNYVDPTMPDIIWFDQGIYLITSFNTSQSVSNLNISISGKDKMCLLNGDISGNLESSVDFGAIEEEGEDGTWTITKIPIPDIIRNMVHQYAGEPYHNIIINDLDTYALELLEYRCDVPMYLYRPADEKFPAYYVYTNVKMESKAPLYEDAACTKEVYLKDIPDEKLDQLVRKMADSSVVTNDPQVFYVKENGHGVGYYFARVSYGDTAGYRVTDLTYSGDLIANVGETLTSVLDKIKNMLNNFEYFYDLQGRFIFQKKPAFINTTWNSVSVDSSGNVTASESLARQSVDVYSFNDGELITAFNNNPNLTNLKNDYSIWGKRKSVSGADIPIHMRYAIDKKPTYYKTYDGTKFYSTTKKTDAELRAEIEAELVTLPTRNVISPNGLPEEWWDIRDWAEYYKIIVGDYPSGQIGTYCVDDEGNKQYVAAGGLKMNDFFHDSPQYIWYDRDIYIFDVIFNGFPNDPSKWTLGYFGHGITCSHTYSYFLNRALKNEGTSFIYKPKIPLEDLSKLEDKIKEIMKSRCYNKDWREIIYQMAKDFYKNNQEDDFEINLINNNLQYYPTGKTGYEQYYIDMEGFWRDLYNPEIQNKINDIKTKQETAKNELTATNNSITAKESDITAKSKEIEDYQATPDTEKPDDYEEVLYNKQAGLMNLQMELANLQNEKSKLEYQINGFDTTLEKYENIKLNFYYPDKDGKKDYPENRAYWNRAIWNKPETLNFWIDFLDSEGELSQFSVKNVGRRSKSINDTNVKSIYCRETPQVIFEKEIEKTDGYLTGYSYIQVANIDSMFSISAQGKSAKDRLDELIYQHSYCIENATITTIPIYYLEPNTRIHLSDQKTKLEGDYIISKLTIPLAFNGLMQITATKAAESII